MDDVGFYGAQRFVSYHHEDLLLFFEVDEVAEPRFFGKPVERAKVFVKSLGDTRAVFIPTWNKINHMVLM